MTKAVFLDRDGVINFERGNYTFHLKDFVINDGVTEALINFQSKGYLLFVITNQSGISKGIYTHGNVKSIHDFLINKLKDAGIKIHGIYYCPHHPEQTNCLCRKPNSLLVEKAIARFDIDPQASFLIGDKERDIVAGGSAGLTGILIESNSSLLELLSVIP